ncbi:MAG: hypothetical protein K2K93_05285 [Muribaculaceae bacterium]|nr:hypothetical protein [Muribaculaceae bacterium]
MNSIKKYMTILAAMPLLWACSADEGSMPGNDPDAAVTLYTYAPTDPNNNPDNDVVVRFVTNNKATSVKYLLAPTSDITALLNNGGESALLSKVEADGKTVEGLGADSFADLTLEDIHGDYTIAAVANGKILGNRVTFLGLDWELVKEGTFIYANKNIFAAGYRTYEASLEICTTDDTLYRINNAFGEGSSLKMYLLDKFGKDDGGKYQYFRVAPTNTGLVAGDMGNIYVRDLGYWQGNAAFVTDYGYESGLYEDGNAFFLIQSYVTAGSFGYEYSYFEPYE